MTECNQSNFEFATHFQRYDTDELAWQHYSGLGSPEDIAETRSLQEQIRNQFEGEQRGRLSRGIEEGYARNTRPRTPKAALQRRFTSSTPGT